MESTQHINPRVFSFALAAGIVIAAIGLAISVASQLASLLGVALLDADQTLAVQVGMIVVLIPVLVVASRMTGNGKKPGGVKMLLSGCPKWARYALKGLFAYAILSAGYFLATKSGNGTFSDLKSAIQVFSSVWALVCGFALAVLYSAVKTLPMFKTKQGLASRQ